jgi:hypothetical protein
MFTNKGYIMSVEIAFLYYVLGLVFLSAKIGFKLDEFTTLMREYARDLDRAATSLVFVLAFQFIVIIWPVALVSTVVKAIRNK